MIVSALTHTVAGRSLLLASGTHQASTLCNIVGKGSYVSIQTALTICETTKPRVQPLPTRSKMVNECVMFVRGLCASFNAVPLAIFGFGRLMKRALPSPRRLLSCLPLRNQPTCTPRPIPKHLSWHLSAMRHHARVQIFPTIKTQCLRQVQV